MGRLPRRTSKHFMNSYAVEYRARFVLSALSLASEFLSRLTTVTPSTLSATNGARMLLYKAFAGPTPASDAADFLDYLEQQLPDGIPEKQPGRTLLALPGLTLSEEAQSITQG